MKFATDRPFADPQAAARKLIEIANSVEAPRKDRLPDKFGTRHYVSLKALAKTDPSVGLQPD